MIAVVALAVGPLVVGPAVQMASAQYSGYFGRNKVQYATFDFEVINTEHFDIYWYKGEEEAGEMAARMAERWYARLSRLLNHEFQRRQPIVLYANHAHFEQTNATPSQIDESTGGFTDVLKRRIVLPLAATLAESDHVLGHEMVHAFQFDMTGQGPSATGPDIPGAIRLPLWFIEGMAEYLSVGPIDPFTTMWIRDAIAIDEFPTIPDLNNPKYFPYRYGHAFWSYVAGNYGEAKIGRILKLAGRTGNPLGSIEAVLEVPIDELSERWRQEVVDYFASIADETQDPEDFGRRVIYEEHTGGQLNLGPSISPDGQQVVYVSERGRFAIEMFVADVATGKVTKKLTKNAVDPHFESLQWINSAGAWHPDGKHFLFSAVNQGKPIVTIMDMDRHKIVREAKTPELGEIYSPTWGPQGNTVAFAASQGGFTDLYIYDFDSEELRRLTEDPYGDLQPAWSPDGRYIAFVTERFGADLRTLTFGPYRLAMYDLETGQIEELPSYLDGKNINPQWSPDGQSLYFVSDHDGISNIYRIDMETRDVYLVTNLYTGVSGLTALSPAISVAKETGDLAFSVNKGGPFNFEIYVTESEETLAGAPPPDFLTEVDPSVIPPRERVSLEIVELLDNERLGLADPITFAHADYKPRLSLDFVSQPSLAFGASSYGVFFAGGISASFSDLLGNRNVSALLQINTSYGNVIQGTALLVGYQNRSSRWNWGVLGGQIPYVSLAFSQIAGLVDDRPVIVYQEQRFFEIRRQLGATIAYPLNRVHRIEFGARLENIDFALEVKEIAYDPATGQIFFEQTTDLASPEDIYVTVGSAALVYDTSIFGGTSPLMGTRYRLEVAPTVGSLNYLNILADYRRYQPIKLPFTLAGRIMHYGRYGGDSDDPRLSRLYIGYPSLVRGYNDGSFSVSECGVPEVAGFQNCTVFNDLLGNRIGVLNLEARLPLVGGIGLVRAPGVPPVEVGAFMDVGVAWDESIDPTLAGCSFGANDTPSEGKRCPVASSGFFGRLNLFGFAIAELDFVYPFDRPDKGWHWQFSLTPGF
jgi:Tol biopolymer transport system component